ncbi:hypothetical protein FIBSPDRAFT_1052486 [Athelia psychrophila]|uniref:Uncharacterized protein n=1 Tax=Athelia psychrophila TaxID=1759441 RepID=A0A165X938_9AGAM|nr:hypothetical protein FIBSPDRAFT_1052486 [Fibularhizoctonia sp. CBS 109695]
MLHGLWLDAFDACTSSPSNQDNGGKRDNVNNEEHKYDEQQVVSGGDAYGEQADLVADAVAKAAIRIRLFVEHQADVKRLVALLVQRLKGEP